MPFDTFDQIQEFILGKWNKTYHRFKMYFCGVLWKNHGLPSTTASLYRIIYKKCLSLDEVLPYSSVFEKKKVPEALDQVPGVTCTTELHAEPVFKGKVRCLSPTPAIQLPDQCVIFSDLFPG
jgi:hypothetical protein